jgi:uncharacterized protein (TIGR03118 family)
MSAIRRSSASDGRGRRWPARCLRVLGAFAATATVAVAAAGPASAGGHMAPGAFTQRNLVSDIPGVARITDPHLVNPWGLAAGPATPLWAADNGADVSTLYSGAVRGAIPMIAPLVVAIPGGAPTGAVFNPTGGFVVGQGPARAAARFVFDSEAGQISGWTPQVPPATQAQAVVATPQAVYKGLALAVTRRRGALLYAADFHGARIDVFDEHFAPVHLRPGAFTDGALPAGFAPFNVQELRGRLYVTYARQDAEAKDDVAGAGLGYVDVFTPGGRLIRRLISQGALNAPWGMAIAPAGFGGLDGALLVGNFGDGAINAYDARTGAPLGALRNEDGNPIRIDGLWSLRFGNGVFGTPRTLAFSAGIADEGHGLLGTIVPAGGGE